MLTSTTMLPPTTCGVCHRQYSPSQRSSKPLQSCHGCLRWRRSKNLIDRLETLLKRASEADVTHTHNCLVEQQQFAADRTRGRFYRDCLGCIRDRLEASYNQYQLSSSDIGMVLSSSCPTLPNFAVTQRCFSGVCFKLIRKLRQIDPSLFGQSS
eukprot:m.195310 g.195310  ORF g.195310 m.195310 type:complete len:154 (+) comp17002_c0_seq2:4503-4964(+)